MDWANILNNLVSTAGNVANTAINGRFQQTASQSGSFTNASGTDYSKYLLPGIAAIALIGFLFARK